MKIYELIPRNGRKSFYGKAQVMVDDNGDETLLSYCTPIMRVNKNGMVTRLYDGELVLVGNGPREVRALRLVHLHHLPERPEKRPVDLSGGADDGDGAYPRYGIALYPLFGGKHLPDGRDDRRFLVPNCVSVRHFVHPFNFVNIMC